MSEGLLLALRTVVSLAVVLALLVFFIRWLDKNSSRARRGRENAQAPVDVLSRTALSRAASVQVVRVGGQVLVLGVTDSTVSVLTDLGPGDFESARPSTGLTDVVNTQATHTDGIVAALLRRQGRHREPAEAQETTEAPEPVERFLVGFDTKERRD